MMSPSDSDVLRTYRAKNAVWTPSNVISAFRGVLAIPVVYFVSSGQNIAAAGVCFVAFLTDILDGYIARRTNDVTELGKVIDPIADKIFVGVLVLVMLMKGLTPLWFMAAVIVRDVVILAAGIWATRKFRVVLPSNYPGKLAVLFISTTLFLTLLGADMSVLGFMQGLSVGLMILSLVLYGQRLSGLLRSTAHA